MGQNLTSELPFTKHCGYRVKMGALAQRVEGPRAALHHNDRWEWSHDEGAWMAAGDKAQSTPYSTNLSEGVDWYASL